MRLFCVLSRELLQLRMDWNRHCHSRRLPSPLSTSAHLSLSSEQPPPHCLTHCGLHIIARSFISARFALPQRLCLSRSPAIQRSLGFHFYLQALTRTFIQSKPRSTLSLNTPVLNRGNETVRTLLRHEGFKPRLNRSTDQAN